MPVIVNARYPDAAVTGPDSPSYDLQWWAQGSETFTDITAAVLPLVSTTFLGLWLQTIGYDHRGAGFWDIHIHYGKLRPIGPGYIVFQAEASGKTVHREQSIGTRNSYAPPGQTAPDFNGLIGVDPIQGTVAGVDTVTPSFGFTLSTKMNASILTPNYLDTIRKMAGESNNAPITFAWKGQIFSFDTEEILFMGLVIGDGGQDGNGNELIELSFKFDTSPTREDISVGGIDGITKKGWDYLWVLRQVVAVGSGTANAALAMNARAVYTEQVYYSDDFNQFNLFGMPG
jgi:hypothetical protein